MGRHSIPDPDDGASDSPFSAVPQPGSGSDEPAAGDGGRWRGGHRNEAGRRGVSIGVVAALITVVAVVGGVIVWRFFGSTLSHRSSQAAAQCIGDDKVAVAVIADPAIADRVQRFADRFNESAKPVGDRCVAVSVKPAGADAVVGGFIGDWPAVLGSRPALWIPGSSISAARLQAAIGQETVASKRSLVTSPVLLAVRPELKPALQKQDWAKLPGLQTVPDALTDLHLPGWGSLKLTLPIEDNSDAAYLAAEAVAAASAPAGAPVSAGTGAVHTLVGAQPKLKDNSLAEAMNALLRTDDPATAPVHAVVTTEQQLFARGESQPDAAGRLGSWQPPGPVPVADYPAVLLRGSWLSDEQVSAASEFARFAAKPEQLAELAEAGFRVEGVSPPDSDVTDFPALAPPLIVGDDALRASLANALTTPAKAPTVTIMLDLSMAAEEGGNTRLANVVAALKHRIAELPHTAAVGLWVFDGAEGHRVLPADPLTEPVGAGTHAESVTAALDGLNSTSGGAVSYTTLRLVYTDAMQNYREGQDNSVLVITTGPHTDRTLDGSGLQDFLRQAADRDRPVAVNVIDFGDDADRPTWQAIAQSSGGGYQDVANSDSPELATALMTLLG